MIFPAPLRKGDTVALLAPSGPQPPAELEAAVESVVQMGLVPRVMPSCRSVHGHLAGSDALRAGDLMEAFLARDIAGILCIRGGYGASRTVPLLDFAAIRSHPKRLLGYSDITTLHTALNRLCGLGTWHTPMPGTEWRAGLDDFTRAALERALFAPPEGALENPPGQPLRSLAKGKATGRLTGGNLTVLTATLGTPYEVDTREAILFIEDIGEAPYRIDRMLTQLRQAGKLHACAGILLGAFTGCEPPSGKSSHSLEQVLEELLGDLGIPALANLCCGHLLPSLCLPMGAALALDADEGSLAVLPA